MLSFFKKQIPEEIEVISFDIFDTLIVRPFYTPTDLFYLIENKIQKEISSIDIYPFHDLRIIAEEEARNKSSAEEITLVDIYEELKNMTSIPENILHLAQKTELELEINLCQKRNALFSVYEYYKHIGKNIIFVSDMYLDENTIRTILKNAGYGKERLFLSSKYKKTKHSGGLFDIAFSEFNRTNIIHIGDSYENDYIMAQKKGVKALHVSKPVDNFQYFLNKKTNNDNHSLISPDKYLGLRSAYALIANKFFDQSHTPATNTADFIGYVYLGLHLYSLSYWILKRAVSCDRLVFCARDGYLPMKAAKIIRKTLKTNISIKYFLASRMALLPFFFYGKHYEVMLNQLEYSKNSPQKIYNLVKDLLDAPEQLENTRLSNNCFKNNIEFLHFLKYIKQRIATKKLEQHIKYCKRYFDCFFKGNVAFFDIGYSLRTETLLHNIYKYDISSYYIHSTSEIASRRAKTFDIKEQSFYQFTPKHAGGLREQLFSKIMNSCRGYEATAEYVKILFDSNSFQKENSVVRDIQRLSLEFVEDFCRIFNDNITLMEIRTIDGSIFFENFMHSKDMADFAIFKQCYFEDVLSSNCRKMSLYDLCFQSTQHKSIFKKAVFCFFSNPVLFYKKIVKIVSNSVSYQYKVLKRKFL